MLGAFVSIIDYAELVDGGYLLDAVCDGAIAIVREIDDNPSDPFLVRRGSHKYRLYGFSSEFEYPIVPKHSIHVIHD